MISFVSFLSYIYALGRTDYTHLRQVFGFPIVFISCYLFFYIFHKIERKLLFKNYDTKDEPNKQKILNIAGTIEDLSIKNEYKLGLIKEFPEYFSNIRSKK